jgi:hypothetical protein
MSVRRLAAFAAVVALSLSATACDKCGNWFSQKSCSSGYQTR